MKISPAGLELAKYFEGLYLNSYQDSVGVWTVGYGRILHDDGTHVGPNEVCIQDQADKWLLEDMEVDGAHFVRAWVKTPLNQNQFDALTDFTFNRGAGRFRELLGMAGSIEDNLLHFDYAGSANNHLLGLQRRRQAERALYLGQPWEQFKTWKPSGAQ